jgi:D-cysteine desulfhydrase
VTTGVWGYICMINELASQVSDVDIIFFASGSGGTAAGIAGLESFVKRKVLFSNFTQPVGVSLCPTFANTKVIGYTVCDSPEYFEQHVQHELDELGVDRKARDLISFRDAKGDGYSIRQFRICVFLVFFFSLVLLQLGGRNCAD